MENDQEVITQNDTETTENTEETIVEDAPEETESVDELKKKLATAEAQKEHWRKKATIEKKEVAEPTGALSSSDLLAVMAAKVHEDDMERVERFAKSEGVSVKEALKNPELKAILDLREEQRNTASASNVSNVRRSSPKITDEVLLDKASKGDLPDSDEEINRLIAAKRKQK